MTKVIYNGDLLDASSGVISINNRGFLFGDGVFESIRVIDGQPCFIDNHFNRMKMGLDMLSIRQPDEQLFDRVEKEMLQLVEANGLTEGGRIRLTMTRASTGFFRPITDNGADYLITADKLPDNQFSLNEKGLNVDIYTDFRKQINRLAYFKTLNCQLYILASIKAKELELDNLLITNENDCIIEAANSNLFIVSNGVLYTPPLADGCLGGTMRMEVINTAIRHGIKVYETTLRPQNLLVADEVFLTNAISGIQWVSAYRQKRYFHNLAQRLVQYLNEEVSS